MKETVPLEGNKSRGLSPRCGLFGLKTSEKLIEFGCATNISNNPILRTFVFNQTHFYMFFFLD